MAFSIALLSRSHLLIALVLLALSLVMIRESGEELGLTSKEISFEVIARGDSDPLPIRTYGSMVQERSCSFRGESRVLGSEVRQVPLRVISEDCSIFFGERISGTGRIRGSEEVRVAGSLIIDEIDLRTAAKFWRILNSLRHDFRQLFAAYGDAGSLVPGMVIGDTMLQSDEFDALMRLAGLSHLTAVSGANFSIVATMVLWLVSLRINDRRIRILITASVLLLFTVIVRPSPSVLRAGVMAAVVLFAQLRGNQRSSLMALAAAVTLLLLVDPYQGLDAGFTLSVLATIAIILISPKLTESMVTRFSFPRPLAEIIAIPVSATLLCTPVVIAISGKLTFASIPLNIIAAPFVSIVTILGFITFLIAPISPLPAHFLAWLAHLAAWPIAEIAGWSYHLPIIEMPFGLAGSLLFLLPLLLAIWLIRGWVNRKGGPRVIHFTLFILLLLPSTQYFSAKGTWQLYQCDVGQGDALLIKTSDDSAMVIDTGPDASDLDRCLRKAGIDEISLLVITHLHADHYGGLTGALRSRKVGQWWLPERDGITSLEVVEDLREEIGSDPRLVSAGMSFAIDQISIDVLWPNHRAIESPRLAGDGSEENNRSIALLIKKDEAVIFAGGDIEPMAQEEIALSHDLSEVDIYKVSHHGSIHRSVLFDQRLNPSLALISVGKSNPYGHPASETLERLAPAKIHRTDLDGAARVTWWPLRIR